MCCYFITGGFGFLGQYIVQAVHDHDVQDDVVIMDHTERRTYLPIQSLERVRFVKSDLSEPDSFTSALGGVDTVIHTAAVVSFKKCDRRAIFETNIVGTRNLVQAAARCGCKNFILISSISAIGRKPGSVADENTLADLAEKEAYDPYGYSKLMSESEVLQYCGTMQVIILNPSVVLGPGSPRIDRIARWLRVTPVLPMIKTMNSFVDVRDVAQAVILALQARQSGERYIVTGHNVDMLTFSQMALRALGSRASVVALPEWLIAPADVVVELLDLLRINPGVRRISDLNVDKAFATDKIRAELGWQPEYSLEQTLADTFN